MRVDTLPKSLEDIIASRKNPSDTRGVRREGGLDIFLFFWRMGHQKKKMAAFLF
jgi:hypothetical protein